MSRRLRSILAMTAIALAVATAGVAAPAAKPKAVIQPAVDETQSTAPSATILAMSRAQYGG